MSTQNITGGTPIVIDASHWQGHIDWRRVAAAGVKAAYLKCSNGAHQTDDTYRRNRDGARAAGIKTGAYAFLLSDQVPEEQAQKLLDNLGETDLIPATDCEYDIRHKGEKDRWLGVPEDSRVAMVGRFNIAIREELGVYPVIYTNWDWWTNRIGGATAYKGYKFAESPLWLARIASKPGKIPPPFTSWAIWQYTWTAHINGIGGDVDGDRLAVPLESLYLKRQ